METEKEESSGLTEQGRLPGQGYYSCQNQEQVVSEKDSRTWVLRAGASEQ